MPAHLARPRLQTLQTILLVAPVLLFSVIAHEIAHGFAALRQGDRTALEAGRLSWNPAKHIDPFFTILLPLMMLIGSAAAGVRGPILGGAKPVPVDPRNYCNVRRGDIIVSLAGVVTNVVIAILCVPVILLAYAIGSGVPGLATAMSVLQLMLVYGILLNLALAAFNMIPIPPLDGSHVMKYLLPPRWSLAYQQLSRYGLFILFALLTFGRPIINLWFTPVYAVNSLLLNTVYPYIIPSQWTT